MPLLPGREGRDWEISGTDEKSEAVRVVFRLNMPKHDLRFEPGGKEETSISRVECCWGVSGNGNPEKMIWLRGGLWIPFEKMVSVWRCVYLSIQGRNPGVIFDTSRTTCPSNTHKVLLNLPS